MTNIKVLSKSFIYGRQQTQSSQLVYCGRKFKLTYDNGNAWEHFTIKLFDGDKFNPIAEMSDLGIKNNVSAYNLLNESETAERVEMLMKKGYEYIKLLT